MLAIARLAGLVLLLYYVLEVLILLEHFCLWTSSIKYGSQNMLDSVTLSVTICLQSSYSFVRRFAFLLSKLLNLHLKKNLSYFSSCCVL